MCHVHNANQCDYINNFILKTAFLLIILLFAQPKLDAQTGNKLKATTFIVPAAFIIYGLSTHLSSGIPSSYQVKDFRNQHFAGFKTKVDNYLQFAPLLLPYGLDLAGVHCTSEPVNRTIIFAKAAVISLALVNILKYSSSELRPDSSARNSFPSGHTAFSFAMASVMQHELADRSIWWRVLGYSCATGVGAMRILNNRHWFNDVLVGAGIGLASGHFASLTHQYKFKKTGSQSQLLPIFGTNYYGLAFNKKF